MFLSMFMMIIKRIANVDWAMVDVSEGKTVTFVHAAFGIIYFTLCYIWKDLVPQIRYLYGAKETRDSAPKNLESDTVNKNDEEDKTEPSTCTIDIGTLEKDVSTPETSETNSNSAQGPSLVSLLDGIGFYQRKKFVVNIVLFHFVSKYF